MLWYSLPYNYCIIYKIKVNYDGRGVLAVKILFSELCDKEVISCAAAKSLGYVCDIAFDSDCGKILFLLVKPEMGLTCFKKSEPICIPWEKVERIGDDFIIVTDSIFSNFAESACGDKRDRGIKMFFSK